MAWELERAAHRCGHRFATYEAHMAHAIYKDKRLERCLDPNECGLFFDGVEWTHIPPGPREVGLDQHISLKPTRKTDTEHLICAKCGAVFAKKPGRGRPPKNCYECRKG